MPPSAPPAPPMSSSTNNKPNRHSSWTSQGSQQSMGSVNTATQAVTNINILVCTANLGNAKPDAASWDAWIPKHGRVFNGEKSTMPVMMEAPPPKKKTKKGMKNGTKQQRPTKTLKGNKPNKQHSGTSIDSHLSNDSNISAMSRASSATPQPPSRRRPARRTRASHPPLRNHSNDFSLGSTSRHSIASSCDDTSIMSKNTTDSAATASETYEEWLAKQPGTVPEPTEPQITEAVTVSNTAAAEDDYDAFLQQVQSQASLDVSIDLPDFTDELPDLEDTAPISPLPEEQIDGSNGDGKPRLTHQSGTLKIDTSLLDLDDDDEENDNENNPEDGNNNDNGIPSVEDDQEEIVVAKENINESSSAIVVEDGTASNDDDDDDKDDDDIAVSQTKDETFVKGDTENGQKSKEEVLGQEDTKNETNSDGEEDDDDVDDKFDTEIPKGSLATKSLDSNHFHAFSDAETTDDDVDDDDIGDGVGDIVMTDMEIPRGSLATQSLDSNHFPAFSDADTTDDDDEGTKESFSRRASKSLAANAFSAFQQENDEDDQAIESAAANFLRDKQPLRSASSRRLLCAPRRTSNISIASGDTSDADMDDRKSKMLQAPRRSSAMRRSSGAKPKRDSLQDDGPEHFFDMIVIGMQEATFELKEKQSKTSKLDQQSKMQKPASPRHKGDKMMAPMRRTKATATSSRSETGPSNARKRISSSASSQQSVDTSEDGAWSTDDDDSLSSLEDEAAIVLLNDDGPEVVKVNGMDDDDVLDLEDAMKSKSRLSAVNLSRTLKNSLTKGTTTAVKASVKAGKAGFHVSRKVGKATVDKAVKTAGTVNTYAGFGKDHTRRQVPAITNHAMSTPGDDNSNAATASSWTDTDTLHYRLEAEQIPGYKRALSYQLGEMRLLIYVRLPGGKRKTSITSVEVESVKYQATGIGGVLANKGGIVADVLVNKTTRLSFLSSHLEAHEGEQHFNARCNMIQDILLGAGHKYYDASQSSHYSFAMGDLNFRTKLEGVKNPDRHIELTHKMAAKKDWRILNEYDELKMALATQRCLVGYTTPYCNFSPTFKVSRQSGYHYNVKRSPSYTDRILFKSADQLDNLTPFAYEAVEQFTSSDHKPIRSAFEVPLNRTLQWKPADPIKTLDSQAENRPRRLHKPKTVGKREKMHFFVSGIKCFVYPWAYDKLKKTEKADAPSPVLLFVTNPNSAIQKDDEVAAKKGVWSKLGLGSTSGKPNKRKPSNTPTAASSNYPATPIQKDTLRPDWGKDSVHFTVNTHKNSGEPINLAGSMLHFCLRDSKQAFLIGSYVMNLAQLISVTRKSSNGPRSGVGGGNQRTPPPGRPSRDATAAAIHTKQPKRHSSTEGFCFASPSAAIRKVGQAGQNANQHVVRASLKLNPSRVIHNPNSLLPTSSAAAHSFKNLASPTTSMRKFGKGPSKSLITSIVNDGDASSAGQAGEKLKGMNLMSLRLEEVLIGGGLEVGHIACSIDVWWADEEEE